MSEQKKTIDFRTELYIGIIWAIILYPVLQAIYAWIGPYL